MTKRRIPPSEEERRRERSTLTPKEAKVIRCLRASLRERGFTSTRAELARELENSQSAIDRRLTQICLKGWATMVPGAQRSIVLTREGAPSVEAGMAHEFVEFDPDSARIDTVDDLLGARPDFYLTITDHSMAGAKLVPGAVVAVARGREPHNGDRVAVQIDGAIELRRYVATDDSAKLVVEKDTQGQTREAMREPEEASVGDAEIEIIGVATHAVIALDGT